MTHFISFPFTIQTSQKDNDAILDPNKVSELVVDARLAQVATKLEQLPKNDESTTAPAIEKTDDEEKKVEEELLGSPKQATPVGSPPPVDSNDGGKGGDVSDSKTNDKVVSANDDKTDAIADRVQTIFGKRRATDELDQSEISPKVGNTGESSTPTIEQSAPPVPSVVPPATPTVSSPVVPAVQNAPPDVRAVDMELDENDKGANNDNDNVNNNVVDNGGNGGDINMWPVEQDQPEGFPDLGFPIEPPTYPTAPEFEYRYRAGANSTPERRRIDFERSIVLPNVRRDPHTGRVSQEDYDAREDAEMALSLG